MNKKWGTNWIDGMKVSSDHFKHDRTYLLEHSKEALSLVLNDNAFGIHNRLESDYYKFSVIDEMFSIHRIKAVSRTGYLYLVNDINNEHLQPLSLKSINEKYENGDTVQLYLKVDTGNWEEIGEIKEDDFPIRRPYSSYRFTVEDMNLSAAMDIKSLDTLLPVAQFMKANGVLMQKTNYIPPVLTVRSNKVLRDLHYSWAEFNFGLANLNSVTAQKISDTQHGSFLRSNILILSTQMAFFLADQIDEFNESYSDRSPHYMVIFYKKMARIINASLIAMKNRERIIQYMADWTDNTPQGFLEKIEEMNDLSYSHLDIISSIDTVKDFIQTIRTLFTRLTELNYFELQDVKTPLHTAIPPQPVTPPQSSEV